MDHADCLLPDEWPTNPEGLPLSAYLLGLVSFDELLRLQRRLHYDVTERRDQAAVVLCEHAPLISVGRHGSAHHIHIDPEELVCRGWPVRWVQRGGGCWLHLPGQLALYLIAPLDGMRLGIADFLARLSRAVCGVLDDFSVRGQDLSGRGGVVAGGRLVAGLGVAVRDWVTKFGACLNIHPDLEAYRRVRSYPLPEQPMTSLERERRGPVRAALVRQRLLEHLVRAFGFSRLSLFTDHAALAGTPRRLATERARVG
jgi:lipoyl(octanoyl) transferase